MITPEEWKERALTAEDRLRQYADPAFVLNDLLDVRGVEPAPQILQWGEDRPACVLIPQWLAEKVWPDA